MPNQNRFSGYRLLSDADRAKMPKSSFTHRKPGGPTAIDPSTSKVFTDKGRYNRGVVFATSAAAPEWLTEIFVDVGNGPGDKANRLAVPVPPVDPGKIIAGANYIMDHLYREDHFGAIAPEDIERELWTHAVAQRHVDSVNGLPTMLKGAILPSIANLVGERTRIVDIGHNDKLVPLAESIYGTWEDAKNKYLKNRVREDAKGGQAAETSENSYGNRPDGTKKGKGWLGELKLPDGKVATEYSVGVNIDGKETLIPSIVPTLSKDQLNLMLTDIIPNGRQVPTDILKVAVDHAKDRLSKGESVWAPEVRQDAKGGEAPEGSSNDEPPAEPARSAQPGGPRIIVNPSTFRNEKDALCVAMNEAFRVIMEVNGFDPVSEPTERQRKFFSDTAYNDDELMLRRTILARICTFDTSVKDPTDEQLQEAMEFLDTVMEIGAPQNEWEQRAVKRIRDMIAQSVGQPRVEEPSDEGPPEDAGVVTGAVGGGESEDDLEDLFDEPSDFDDGSLDSLFDTRSNTEKETEQVINEIGKEGSAVVEGVEQLDPEGTKKALEYGKQMSEAVNNGFDASTQLPNSDPPQITSTSSDDAQQPAAPQLALPMKNGHYVDDQGRVITKRAAEALAASRGNTSSQPASTGTSPAVTGIGGRKLTTGEAAWQERREASRRRSNRNGRDLTVFI